MIPIYGTIRVMIENLTTVKTASKDILARAMAREDINVEHRADAQTAYFDTNQRTLCLPVWKDMSNALYDMLVGHEISHALHTPAEGWADWVGTGPNAQMRHMFLNVTEDARIERMVKEEFPGIRRLRPSVQGTTRPRSVRTQRQDDQRSPAHRPLESSIQVGSVRLHRRSLHQRRAGVCGSNGNHEDL